MFENKGTFVINKAPVLTAPLGEIARAQPVVMEKRKMASKRVRWTKEALNETLDKVNELKHAGKDWDDITSIFRQLGMTTPNGVVWNKGSLCAFYSKYRTRAMRRSYVKKDPSVVTPSVVEKVSRSTILQIITTPGTTDAQALKMLHAYLSP